MFITTLAATPAPSQPNHHSSDPKSTPAAVTSSKAEPTTTIAHNSIHTFPSHHVDKPDLSAHKPSAAPVTPTSAQQHHQASSSPSANNHHQSNIKPSSPSTSTTSHQQHQHHHSLNAASPVTTLGSKSTTTSSTSNTSSSSSSSTPTSSNTMLPSSQQKNEGLSGGAVTAIVIVGLIGLAGLVMWVVMRKKKRRTMLRGQAQAQQQPDPFTMGFGSHDPPPHTAYNMTASASSHGAAPSPMIQMPPIGASANASNGLPPPHPHPPVVGNGAAGNDAPSYSYNSFPAQEGTTPHAIGVFTVISTYTPTLSDELDIQPGDRVEILIEYDDGWCQGINLSRGNKKGVFPKHCADFYQYNTQQQQYYEPANMKRVSSMYMSPHQNAQQQKAYYL